MKKTTISVLVLAAAWLGGCGDDDGSVTPGPDAGMADASMGDAGGDPADAGGDPATGTCERPRTLTLATGSVTTLTGDTTDAPSSLAMTTCGSGQAEPQDVIALTLPGDPGTLYGVRYDFARGGTAESFDTVTQVRETCGDETGAVCVDDGEEDYYRSVGGFGAPGGSTRFLIVTGYTPWDEDIVSSGPYEATFEVVGPIHRPVLTGGTVLNVEGLEQHFTLMGTDADMDVIAFSVQFLDASGAVIGIEIYEDEPPVDTFVFSLEGAEGMASFTGTSIVDSEGVTELAAATRARIALIDAFNLSSDPVEIAITTASFVGVGETCDETHLCNEELECASGTCTVPAAVQAECDAAAALTLTTTSSATVVTIPAGDGHLTGSCAGFGTAFGAEAFVEVTGAEGHDIVIETAGTTTGSTDTVLYAMTTCGLASTEVACNDDRPDAEGTTDSRLEILDSEARTYAIAVEVYGGAEGATMVDVVGRLRPVLATGDACDPEGAMNRCASGACPSTGEAVCP